MTDIVIQAESLGKKYTIGHQAERNRDLALRDVLVQNAHALNAVETRTHGRALSTQRHQATKVQFGFLCVLVTWWFLSPAARQTHHPGQQPGRGLGAQGRELRDPARGNGGRTEGIIGRNGAGKSTVLRRRNTWLKVLSRITEPSAGRMTIKGRAASLLETCPEQGRRGGHGLSSSDVVITAESLNKKCSIA